VSAYRAREVGEPNHFFLRFLDIAWIILPSSRSHFDNVPHRKNARFSESWKKRARVVNDFEEDAAKVQFRMGFIYDKVVDVKIWGTRKLKLKLYKPRKRENYKIEMF